MPSERILPAVPVRGGKTLLASSFEFAFTGEDAIEITSVCLEGAYTVEMTGRWLNTDGSIQVFSQQHVCAAPAAWSTTYHYVGRGYLLNATVRVITGTPNPAALFVRVDVVRGQVNAAVVVGTLIQGYVTARQWRAWPGSPLQDASEGPPTLKTGHLGAFAGGVEATWGPTTPARWNLLSVRLILVTAGAAGVRYPMLTYVDGFGREFARSGNPGSCNTGVTATFEWSQGLTLQGLASPNAFVGGLLSAPGLAPGMTLQTLTSGLALTDHWDEGVYLVEERVDGS
jgi:hypothetical protein